MNETQAEDNKFHCPICHEDKDYSVRVTIEFPNPLMEKYSEVVLEPYTCELYYCHTCVFKIFKKTYPDLHEDLRSMVEEDDEGIDNAIKHGKLICAECGTKMDDKHGLSCEDREDLK